MTALLRISKRAAWGALTGATLLSLACSGSSGTAPVGSAGSSSIEAAGAGGLQERAPSGTHASEPAILSARPELQRNSAAASPAAPAAPGAPAMPAVPVLVPGVLVGDGASTTVQEVRAVQLSATVSGRAGKHEVTMEVITPSQASFERRVQSIHLDGSTSQQIRFELPVAGTLIQTANLTGVWSARFFLDGQEVAAQDFELTP